MHRTEKNAQTGEVITIQQKAYRNAAGDVLVLDEGQKAPSGFSEIDPATIQPAVVVPALVTMRQARLALLAADLLDDITSAVASLPGTPGAAARIEWEYAANVRRDSPLVQALAAQLKLTEKEIDSLFIAAAEIGD